MHLNCTFDASIGRASVEDYIREVIVDVMEYDEAAADRFLVGRISLQHIVWPDIQLDGESGFVVCDEHSEELAAIFSHFIDERGDVYDEFFAEEPFRHLVVLDRMVLHSDVLPAGHHVLEAALNLFGGAALVLSWREAVSLSESQLSELGFRKAAETNFIYRHSSMSRDYEDKYPQGCDPSVEATDEHEQWVLDEWDKLPEL